MCRWNDARFTDKHARKQGVQGAGGSVRAHNDRELEVQFGWKYPIQDTKSSALPASETAVRTSRALRAEKTASSTPASAPASITGRDDKKAAPTTESIRQKLKSHDEDFVNKIMVHTVSKSFRRVSSADGCGKTMRHVRKSCVGLFA